MKKRGQNEGSIYKSGNRYRVQFSIGYDETGKLIRKSFYEDTLTGARDRLEELKYKYSQSLEYDDDITLTVWAEKALEVYVRGRVADKTLKMYASILRKYALPRLGRMRLGSIRSVNIQECVNAVKHMPRTALYVKQTLTMIFNRAVNEGVILRSPVRNIKTPPLTKKRFVFDAEALRELADGLKDSPTLLLGINILLHTGLRRSELVALTWSDIDFKRGMLKVDKTLQRVGQFAATKTIDSNRDIPMSPALLAMLQAHRESRPYISTFVLEHNNKSYTPNGFYHSVSAKIGHGVKLHDLRHYFATTLYRHGANIKIIQELLGHSDIQVTLNTYSHVIEDEKREAVNIIDMITGKAEKKDPKQKSDGGKKK
ncbi:MAG: tyrosine-type recombinase/integrase [Negativicutes bacterium]|jgi:integrase